MDSLSYVMSVYKNTISLFGGQTVTGAITLNPSTGELTHYALQLFQTGSMLLWTEIFFAVNTTGPVRLRTAS